MPKSLPWRSLLPGLVALGLTIGIAFVILVFARVGALHGRTDRLYATIDEARGVLKGTPVELNGEPIGIVRRVDFAPPSTPAKRRVIVVFDVHDEYMPHLRADSPVSIQTAGSFIGAPVIYVGTGTERSRRLRDGDTLYATAQVDLENAASEFAIASRQFPAIIGNMKVLATEMTSAKGTLGALGIGGTPELSRASAQASRLMARVSSSHGTLGRVLSANSPLGRRAQELVAGADSVMQVVSSPLSAMGRFHRDSTLARNVADLSRRMRIVSAAARSPDGNLGRFGADSAVFQSLARAQAEMAALMADLQHHPLKYVHF